MQTTVAYSDITSSAKARTPRANPTSRRVQYVIGKVAVEDAATGDVLAAEGALRGIRSAPELVTHISELLQPRAVEALAERGFFVDDDGLGQCFEPPAGTSAPTTVRIALVLRATEEISRRLRTVQRVLLHYDRRGRIVAVQVWTYSPPPDGDLATCVEVVTHWPRTGSTQRLAWNTIEL